MQNIVLYVQLTDVDAIESVHSLLLGETENADDCMADGVSTNDACCLYYL